MSLRAILDEYFGEFRNRFAGRHFGKFRAVVTSVEDPKRLGRIRVKCPHLFGDTISGWCWPSSAMGSNSSGAPHGFVALPEPGAMVWIELEEGNTGRPPLWTSGMWSKDSLPDHVRALPDESDLGIKGITGMVIPPSSTNVSEYGKVRVWQMPSGARLEFDETEGEERVLLHHKSGAHVEMLSDGTIHIGAAGGVRAQASTGNWKRYVAQSVLDTVDGAIERTVGTKWKMTVDQGAEFNIGGAFAIDTGTYDLVAAGDYTFTVGTYSGNVLGNYGVSVSNQMSIGAGTDMFLQASGAVQLVGQNNVTNGGLPTDLGVEVGAYNSRAEVYSTDATGVAARSGAEYDAVLGSTIDFALAGVSQGKLNLGVGGIASLTALVQLKLGSATLATEPLVLGIALSSLLTTLAATFDAHTHISGAPGLPTAPPLPLLSPIISPLLPTIVSTKVWTE